MADKTQVIPQNKPALQIHFVGSVPLASSAEVFQRLLTTFPTAFVESQMARPASEIISSGGRERSLRRAPGSLATAVFRKLRAYVTEGSISLNPLEYDDFALASYADFCELREQGIIPPSVRFQVCLPTAINVMRALIRPEYHAEVEPLYEKALLAALQRIQVNIPKEDLAVQWDAVLEFAMIEEVNHPGFSSKAWFSPLKEGLEQRFTRLTAAVDEGVEMGFHLCYGEIAHKHFVEPKDAGHLVKMANLISSLSPREVNWIHMPVPKDRLDKEYYAPMKN